MKRGEQRTHKMTIAVGLPTKPSLTFSGPQTRSQLRKILSGDAMRSTMVGFEVDMSRQFKTLSAQRVTHSMHQTLTLQVLAANLESHKGPKSEHKAPLQVRGCEMPPVRHYRCTTTHHVETRQCAYFWILT